MRMNIVSSLSLVILFTTPLFAGNNTVFDFLRTDVSARAGALAGSFVSISNDPNTIFYNSAGLSTLEAPQASLGFFKHLLDINAGYLSYGQEVEDIGYLGAGIMYMNYGSFDETDDLGNQLGTFNASDLSFVVGYSNLLDENLHFGVNLKFIYSSIAGYTSTGLAGDLGILYRIPESNVAIGASIRNIGAQLSSYLPDASGKEKLPLDLNVGGSVVPKGLPLLLNVNFHKLNESAENFGDRFKSFSVGGEFTLSKTLQLRFGYNNERRQELKTGTTAGLAGFSGGVGINVQSYNVDYALSSLGSIGNLHRVTIGVRL